MSVTPKDIDDHIIDVVKQITRAAQTKNPQSTVPPLQKELKLYIVPRWDDILNYSPHFKATLEKKVNRRAYGGAIDPIQQTIEDIFLQKVSNWKWFAMQVTKYCPEVVEDLELLKTIMKYARQKLTTTQTDNGSGDAAKNLSMNKMVQIYIDQNRKITFQNCKKKVNAALKLQDKIVSPNSIRNAFYKHKNYLKTKDI